MKSGFLLSLILYLVSPGEVNMTWNTYEYMRREHSLIKPFHGSGSSLQNWDLVGTAFATDSFVRLTPDGKSTQGGLWNKYACYSRNWELEVQFKVHGRGKDLFGDGFAIWYTRERNTCPGGPECTVFGNKDYFVGLGVIMDTYNNYNGVHNHEHPYISAMVNNGTLHYDHDRDGTHTQMAGCTAKFRGRSHDTYVKVKYYMDTISVFTDVEDRKAWSQCLSVPGVTLPTGFYFGITAATGDLSDNHDIISVRMYDLDAPEAEVSTEDRSKLVPSASVFDAPRDHVDDPKPSLMSGFKKLLLVIIGVVVVCGAVFIGGIFYVKQKEESRKRFY